MKRESQWNLIMGWLAPVLVGLALASCAVAQAPKSDAVPAKAAKAKKTRGRLPAYYGKVVTDKQRQQIYAIQAKYQTEIVKLKQKLVDLITKQKSEIEGVLTEQQRDEIQQLRSKRKSARVAKSSSAKPPAGGTTKQ